MKIDIRIEKLVLNGFDYHDHRRISAALEQELAILIKKKGLPDRLTQGDEIPLIFAPSFTTPIDMNPRTIGAEVARSIYRAWKSDTFGEPVRTSHRL
jgi:hypothetical protein